MCCSCDCLLHAFKLTLYSQLGGVGKWDTDHGEELSQCTGTVEVTQWYDVLLESLLLTDCRLNVHYPARRAILPVTRNALALAQHMLHTDHSQRPTAQECLKSAYFIDSSTTVAVHINRENKRPQSLEK